MIEVVINCGQSGAQSSVGVVVDVVIDTGEVVVKMVVASDQSDCWNDDQRQSNWWLMVVNNRQNGGRRGGNHNGSRWFSKW